MPDINKKLPYRLEIDGIVLGRFGEISMTGEDLHGKQTGQAVHGVVTLKRGISDSPQSLYEWHRQTGKSKEGIVRRKITILKNEKGRDVATWSFIGAWPSKFDAPDFDAKGNDVAIETLEIAHEGMERADSPQAEFLFVLPRGYVDRSGNLHREGTMRLATAADEILPLKDPRVQANPAYLKVIIMSRVVTRLGSLQIINPGIVEGLFAGDLVYLQELYNRINGNGTNMIKAVCPCCAHSFDVEIGSGE